MAKKNTNQFSANAAAQSVYRAVHDAIRKLSNEQALQVLEEVVDHLEAMEEGIREDLGREDE